MIFLFLDTSSDNLVVSLLRDNEIINEKRITSLNDHSSYLAVTIREVLNESNIKLTDINKILVAVGPGSFTGTRIGITTAKTIAWALNIKVVPVSSLKEYIFSYSGYDYYIPLEEDKKGSYVCVYDKEYNEVTSESYLHNEELIPFISKYKNALIISNKNYDGLNVKEKVLDTQKLINYYKDCEEINPHNLKPNYIKKIDAESKL